METYWHFTWRRTDAEGETSTYVHVEPDAERAADMARELLLTEGVSAVRLLHYPESEGEGQAW